MLKAIGLFPATQTERSALNSPRVPSPSGFFGSPTGLVEANLAAAVVLALHRGLISQPDREHLPLRAEE